jgi:murein DD-endopeptidase MepM/ murein hydrolase activator NlpD
MRDFAHHALRGQRVARRRLPRRGGGRGAPQIGSRSRRISHSALHNQHPRRHKRAVQLEELSTGAAVAGPLPSAGAALSVVLPPSADGGRWADAAADLWDSLRAGAARVAARGARPFLLPAALVLLGAAAVGLMLHYAPSGTAVRDRASAAAALLPPDGRLQRALIDTLSSLGAAGAEHVIAPSPVGAASADGGVRFHRYQVAAGDSLGTIAERFDVTLDTIISFNELRRERDLREGLELVVPSHSGVRYTVRRGDNLSRIATRHGVSLDAILDVNDVASSIITPGQILLIPGVGLSENVRNRVLGQLFIMPARGRFTSPYGYRNDPFTGLRKFHNGIDIANGPGTAVVASMSGTVATVGYNGNYGRYVIVRHADGFQTLYAHLSRTHVSQADSVRQGQQLGEMGNTGYSTGNHLHFSIFLNGTHVDPQEYLD